MTTMSVIDYRRLDMAHRILRQGESSASGVGGPFGDSVGLPDIYYVDSGSGSDGNDGRDPAAPLATIDAANNKCTASQGDIILVQPGHSETLSAEITLDVIGVQVIGVGEGSLRPQITQGFAGDAIAIDAANVTVQNLYFNEATTAPGAGGAAIDINAAFAKVIGCRFDLGTDDLEAITITATGDDSLIEDCMFVVTANGPDAGIEIEAIVERVTIRKCVFDGGTDDWDTGGVNSGVAHIECLIEDNVCSGGPGIIFSAAATGMIHRNMFGGGTLASMLDPGSCMNAENYESDAIDQTGRLFPTTAAS